MRAVVYESFSGPVSLQEVPDPATSENGVVIRVQASGLCLSDWHGWQGHDPDIHVPHVPGHELAGVIEAVGPGVRRWEAGARVTLPFVCGCGRCPQCLSGNHQVCDAQFQPGFTHWGSFAEYVAVDYADVNLVRLPDEMSAVTAAMLGCRFATAFRAIQAQGRVSAGEWVAVHGCGGVGLSAIMIAAALGARVVAVDLTEAKLALAQAVGAEVVVNASQAGNVPAAVMALTGGGAHVSIDALGSPVTCYNSIASLRKRGRHIQVGLLTGDHRSTAVPMDRVVAHELEILGSHGIQAYRYEALFAMIEAGKLHPEKLVGKTISLAQAPQELVQMDQFKGAGITVIDQF